MDYLLKSSAIIALFFICYRLFLQRETFFESNRWFLLTGLIIAACLPSVVIPIYIEYTPVLSTTPILFSETVINNTEPFNWTQLLGWTYALGVSIFLVKLLIELTSLQRLITKNPKKKIEHFSLIEIFEHIAPFSFFKWIVYNPKQFKKQELIYIINHEKVHAKEHHTLDVLIAQLCCALFWFNPFIWLYKKDLQQNLEFIADEKAQTYSDCKESYQRLLLKASVPNHPLALTNNFYNSLIKKRIIMLHKSKSNKLNAWKYAVILPVLAIFLMSFNTKEVFIAKDVVSSAILEKEFIVTANSSDNDLDAIKNYFKNKPVQLQFSNIERNSDNTLKSLTLNTKHENGTDYTKRMTVSKNNDNIITPFKLSYNSGEDDIILHVITEDSNTAVSKHNVVFGKDNTTASLNTKSTTQSEDNSLGKNPIYVIGGKHYKKEDLPKKAFTTTGSIEQLSKKESEKRFGKSGKDGAVIFNGRTTFENAVTPTNSRLNDIVITKNYSEADLNLAKAQLEKEGLKTKIRGVKRNSNGEIIAIKIEVSSEDSKASFNLNTDEPINPIQISFDADGKNISIGSASKKTNKQTMTIISDNGQAHALKSNEGKIYSFTLKNDDSSENTDIETTINLDNLSTNDNVYFISSGDSNHADVVVKDENGNLIKNDDKIFISTTKSNSFNNKISSSSNPKTKHMIVTKKIKDGKLLKEEITIEGENTFVWESDDENDEQVEFVFKSKDKGNIFHLSTDQGGSPYILLNGKEITKMELDKLDSDTFKSMNVLKGENAINKYGSKAKEGAIIITTK